VKKKVEGLFLSNFNYIAIIRLCFECLDPLFVLKGAARPAQEYYRPVDYKEDAESINLLEQMNGRLWDHAEGQSLLKALHELGLAQHNIGNKSKQAVITLKELLDLDHADHLVSFLFLIDHSKYITMLDSFSMLGMICFDVT
jgi:hypothetical protein